MRGIAHVATIVYKISFRPISMLVRRYYVLALCTAQGEGTIGVKGQKLRIYKPIIALSTSLK